MYVPQGGIQGTLTITKKTIAFVPDEVKIEGA
jgi:hypothetical protein